MCLIEAAGDTDEGGGGGGNDPRSLRDSILRSLNEDSRAYYKSDQGVYLFLTI